MLLKQLKHPCLGLLEVSDLSSPRYPLHRSVTCARCRAEHSDAVYIELSERSQATGRCAHFRCILIRLFQMGIMNPNTTNLIDFVAQLVDSARQLPGLWGRKARLSNRCKVLHVVDKDYVVVSDHWGLYRCVVEMDWLAFHNDEGSTGAFLFNLESNSTRTQSRS